MTRGVLGVLAGVLVWMPAFLILAQLPLAVWPAYAAAVEAYTSGARYEFTPAMSSLNALLWILAEVFAGWLAVVIAKRRGAAWVLAALLFVTMGFFHLYYYWDRYPWWYNLSVVIPVVPAVLLGGRLARTRVEVLVGLRSE